MLCIVIWFVDRWSHHVAVHTSVTTLARKHRKPRTAWNTFGCWLMYWRCVKCHELCCFCAFVYFHVRVMLTTRWICGFTLKEKKKSDRARTTVGMTVSLDWDFWASYANWINFYSTVGKMKLDRRNILKRYGDHGNYVWRGYENLVSCLSLEDEQGKEKQHGNHLSQIHSENEHLHIFYGRPM